MNDNIKREIRKIPVDVIERVIDNFNARIGTVIRRQGAWIEHTVLSTIIRNRKVSCFHVLSQLEDIIFHHAGINWQKNFHDMLFE